MFTLEKHNSAAEQKPNEADQLDFFWILNNQIAELDASNLQILLWHFESRGIYSRKQWTILLDSLEQRNELLYFAFIFHCESLTHRVNLSKPEFFNLITERYSEFEYEPEIQNTVVHRRYQYIENLRLEFCSYSELNEAPPIQNLLICPLVKSFLDIIWCDVRYDVEQVAILTQKWYD